MRPDRRTFRIAVQKLSKYMHHYWTSKNLYICECEVVYLNTDRIGEMERYKSIGIDESVKWLMRN